MMPSNLGSASGMIVRSGWLVCTVWAEDSHENVERETAQNNKVMSFMARFLTKMEWRWPPPSATAAKVVCSYP